MRLLIVTETSRVALRLASKISLVEEPEPNLKTYGFGSIQIDLLVTGVGSPFMIYQLTRVLKSREYDMVFNIGLSESFDHFLEQGFVVNVVQDQFADLGIEHNNNFFTLGEEELMNDNTFPFTEGKMLSLGNFELAEVESLIPVKGITVNALRSDTKWVEMLKVKYEAEVQSMSGAAFFYACLMEKVPFLQIRSISGFAEIRRVDSWNIPIAVNNLVDTTMEIIKELQVN